MKIFNADIDNNVASYLYDELKNVSFINDANSMLYNIFNIENFFIEESDLDLFKNEFLANKNNLIDIDRTEYGDFQTNIDLSDNVVSYLKTKKINPEIIIEPTCGKGNFIISSLKKFNDVKEIIGIEIYKPYIWEAKFNILKFYLENNIIYKPKISIIHSSVFDFNFDKIKNDNLLVIGNPPWVTNSKLGSLNSLNLPKKNNFKNLNGIDAITGKGNFDIAEYITLMIIDKFQNRKGDVALLVKNSVIKNILFDQKKQSRLISNLEKHCIDSKKEFDVSVQASLFYCKLNSNPDYYCKEFDFYNNENQTIEFGWFNDKYVSNLSTYIKVKNIDGVSPIEWRQGLKHDCTAIMEIEKFNDNYINKLNREFELEEELVYPILKSSDLKYPVIKNSRKYTIVTQRKVGQETNYIKYNYPNTYEYLISNLEYFNSRKSSIYKNKPMFSIFGIGEYSFKPFKIAISSMYKTFHFSLIMPQDGKSVMLDDTCYMLGFNNLDYAVYTYILLNSELNKDFLKSITFSDAKRIFTKDVLMRIDIAELANKISKDLLSSEIALINNTYNINVNLDSWNTYMSEISNEDINQLELFN